MARGIRPWTDKPADNCKTVFEPADAYRACAISGVHTAFRPARFAA